MQCEFNDRGELLILDGQGDLFKYSKEGVRLQNYTSDAGMNPDKVQVISVFKNMLFYQAQQKSILLDQYLSASIQVDLTKYDVRFIDDLVMDTQQNLWFLDGSNFTLNQLNTVTSEVLLTKFLDRDSLYSPDGKIELLSYRNQIYLVIADQSIVVLDNLGNQVKVIPVKGLNSFGMTRDQYYYALKGQIVLEHLYSEKREEIPLPSQNFDHIYFHDDILIGVRGQGFEIYQYLRQN